MTMISLTDVLTNAILEEYTKLEDAREEAIDPAQLADRVQARFDPDKLAPREVEWSSLLHLRELARRICAKRVKQDQSLEDAAQEQLFSGTLQHRYPCDRGGVPCYVLRSRLTREEYQENIHRLETESTAKLEHALLLTTEMNRKIKEGLLQA